MEAVQTFQVKTVLKHIALGGLLAVALLSGCGEKGEKEYIEELSATDVDTRRRAAEALGTLGQFSAIRPLLEIAESDSSETVRQTALVAVSQVRARLITANIAMLNSEVVAQRRAAVAKFGTIGGPIAEPLIAALSDTDPDVRRGAVKLLSRIGPSAVEPLIAALRSNDAAVRGSVARLLGEIGDARAVEPLIWVLGDPHSWVQFTAAIALGNISDASTTDVVSKIGPSAVDRLIAALSDTNSAARVAAAKLLGDIGGARAVGKLIAALDDPQWQVQQEAMIALGLIGDDRTAELIFKGGPPAVELMVEALRDENLGVRRLATEIISKIGASAVVPLLGALRDADSDVGRRVVEILSKVGAPAVEPLISALRHRDLAYRTVAVTALGEIGDARAVDPLLAALVSSQNRYFTKFRGAAATALASVGDVTAIPRLVALITDKELSLTDRELGPFASDILSRLGWTPDNDELRAQFLIASRNRSKILHNWSVVSEYLTGNLRSENLHSMLLARIIHGAV